jgi:hypothetical protein
MLGAQRGGKRDHSLDLQRVSDLMRNQIFGDSQAACRNGGAQIVGRPS